MKNKLAVLLMMGVLCTAGAADAKTESQKEKVDTYEMLNLFGEVMERAKSSYVEEVEDKKLIESAINGMLVSLDPHSSYLDEQSFKYRRDRAPRRQARSGRSRRRVPLSARSLRHIPPS